MGLTIYPAKLKRSTSELVMIEIPDFSTATQGYGYTDALVMAADAICMLAYCRHQKGEELPVPSKLEDIEIADDEIGTIISVDFEAYFRNEDTKIVRRNISLPSWLVNLAEERHINISAVTKEALLKKLKVKDK